MDTEEWRQISDAPDYAVSSLGRIKRITAGPRTHAGKILSQPRSTNGYHQVNLVRVAGVTKTCKVHLLVARAFHGPRPSPGHQVAHRDGNKDNNSVANLRWADRFENAADDLANGSRLIGEKHRGAVLTEKKVLEIRASDEHVTVLAKKYGVSRSCIEHVVKRRLWRHLP